MPVALGSARQMLCRNRSGGSQVPCSLALSDRPRFCRFRPCLDFRFVFQKLVDALFKRRQIIRDAPSQLLPVRSEFNAADQVWRSLEPDAYFSREGFVERVLY